VNLGFNEPCTRDVFALGFEKRVEVRRGLPRTGLGFCELVRLTKCKSWVWRAFGETTRELSVQGFWRDSPASLVCAMRVSCSCIHVILGVACTRLIMLCSCIRVTHEVVRTRDMVLLHTCYSWGGTYWRLGVVLLHTWHLWSGMY